MSDQVVLLVEDDADAELLVRRALQLNHILNAVVVAHDGAEALELLFAPTAPLRPALILLDLNLPRIGGLAVLERLRAAPDTRLLPVVIMTASPADSDMRTGYQLGANSYIRKPVSFEQYVEAVRHLSRYWLTLNEPPPPVGPMPDVLRVLSVEDNEDDYALLMRELRRAGYLLVTERVQTAAELAAALQRAPWDLILSDFSLPTFSAPEALAVLQASGHDLPFIIVSGTVGEATAVAALKAGAHDFLTKGSLPRLIPAIQREMRDAEVRRQRRRAEAAANEQRALADALRDTAAALTRTLDFDMLLDLILVNVERVVPHDAANIMLLDGAQARVVRRSGLAAGSRAPDLSLPLADFPTLQQMLTTGEPLVIAETAADSRWVPLPQSRWINAYLGTPFRAKDKIIGFLSLNSGQPGFFQPEHSERLQAFADHAAAAVENATLFENLQASSQALAQAYEATIAGWSAALDLRDKETEGHSQRVTDLTLRLAQALHLSGEELNNIRRGALLHDIGKMGIPDAILLKPAPLTDEEWVSMRRHPTYAYEMLSRIDYLVPALAIPFCHHEKWDGSGYPRGLRGEQIPLAARLFAVVDVWDALRSNRPYRPAWPADQVLQHLQAEAGRHFDPQVVAVFAELITRGDAG